VAARLRGKGAVVTSVAVLRRPEMLFKLGVHASHVELPQVHERRLRHWGLTRTWDGTERSVAREIEEGGNDTGLIDALRYRDSVRERPSRGA
jgi:hypothetical protein